MVKKAPDAFYIFSVRPQYPIQIPSECTVSLDSAPWRPRLGEIITVQDRQGRHFRARVFHISEFQCKAHLFEHLRKDMESHLDILLLQALPEKERMEWIIQKATELGVNSIVPFSSKRSTTLEEREKKQPKAHRWPIIAQKAAQQCRRAVVPVIGPYTDFSDALRRAEDYELRLLLWEAEQDSGLSGEFTNDMKPSRISILVGPEGGLTQAEVKMAQESGFVPVGLGPRILRTETAAIAIIAIVQYRWGDLG